jgi:hypothetical protein
VLEAQGNRGKTCPWRHLLEGPRAQGTATDAAEACCVLNLPYSECPLISVVRFQVFLG